MEKSRKQRAYTKEFKEESSKIVMKSDCYAKFVKNFGIQDNT